mgnify:CR=1 FL=1
MDGSCSLFTCWFFFQPVNTWPVIVTGFDLPVRPARGLPGLMQRLSMKHMTSIKRRPDLASLLPDEDEEEEIGV